MALTFGSLLPFGVLVLALADGVTVGNSPDGSPSPLVVARPPSLRLGTYVLEIPSPTPLSVDVESEPDVELTYHNDEPAQAAAVPAHVDADPGPAVAAMVLWVQARLELGIVQRLDRTPRELRLGRTRQRLAYRADARADRFARSRQWQND